MSFLRSPVAERIGFVLTRVVVPAWVGTGPVVKLVERTPSLLPSGIVELSKNAGIDLGVLLHTIIGLEFLAVAVMVFVARLARPMAIFILSSFCLVLLIELYRRSESCGCFGKLSIHPGVMLALDGTLLVLAALFKPPASATSIHRGMLAGAAVTILAGFGISFALMGPAIVTLPPPPPDGTTTTPATGCQAMPPQIPAPNFWYVKEGALAQWQGQCWNQIDLFQIIRQYPQDIATGRRHVVFYRRDCEHCEDMFKTYFNGGLPDSVVAYRIPSDETWAMPPTTRVALIDLPARPDLVIETPLVITLEDGKVVCAVEGEGFEQCFK